MKRTPLYIIMYMLGLLVACDTVHEFPEEPKEPPYAKLLLRLKYATEMPIQEHYYQTRSTDSIIDRDIRYLIKAYPVLADGRTSQEVQGQFLFSRDAAMGYDYDCWLDLPPGRYNIMVSFKIGINNDTTRCFRHQEAPSHNGMPAAIYRYFYRVCHRE